MGPTRINATALEQPLPRTPLRRTAELEPSIEAKRPVSFSHGVGENVMPRHHDGAPAGSLPLRPEGSVAAQSAIDRVDTSGESPASFAVAHRDGQVLLELPGPLPLEHLLGNQDHRTFVWFPQ